MEASCATQLSEASAALGRRAPAAAPRRVPDPKAAPSSRFPRQRIASMGGLRVGVNSRVEDS